MAGAEAAAWWTEVEDVRARIERRRTMQAEPAESEPRRSRPAVANAETAPDSAREPITRSGEVEPAARRTVRIRGQAIPTVVAPRLRPTEDAAPLERRAAEAAPAVRRPYGTTRPARPRPRATERIGANPDRLAAWAFALALLTLLVAAISAHGL